MWKRWFTFDSGPAFFGITLIVFLSASLLTANAVRLPGESDRGIPPQEVAQATADEPVAHAAVDEVTAYHDESIWVLRDDLEASTGIGGGGQLPSSSATAPQERDQSLPKRVGIQAGHWRSAELPAELASLRGSTGTSGGGAAEWQVNLDVARRTAALLESAGLIVDILPATVPPGYEADAFVALHCDGNNSSAPNGFKLARSSWSVIQRTDDALLAAITAEYRAATGMPWESSITRNMTGYYAFNNRRFTHAIAPTTPAVILEMGFLTSPKDRQTLLGAQDAIAEGIARGILKFLQSNPA